jgi:hypothetical protein
MQINNVWLHPPTANPTAEPLSSNNHTHLLYTWREEDEEGRKEKEKYLPSSLALNKSLLKSFSTPIFRTNWSPEHISSLLFTNHTVAPYQIAPRSSVQPVASSTPNCLIRELYKSCKKLFQSN